ncbi:hypothetical protein B1987_24195 [Mycobacterium kansasii]|uniref:Putative PE-PGRS family protein PE_PGRS24 n=1 Tax=Mycobacterium attenuatum TaxID=2341086 RepID=A0A498Q9P8_9MYCO|nr:hypothetical protein B1987_05785 [Mycobacterium kansasii]ORB86361.1 hypothetical protein B1987_24195 [Mycobacterium kansasii]VBA41292.1 putative PE-PGRS family protein PE_PGRS24 [Mycobacterium attenuatum]VBA57245.1 putative PE-PGRS family protein PE_PGRS24 [Mycobacterium attenuatum]VBA60591.1 putative PE-PGRS family protein PE_PGRS24 [Mycobacterium attenuatum]
MSFLIAAPTELALAAADLSHVASAIGAANAAAFAPTTTVVAVAADEVPVQIAALFADRGQSYQTLSAQTAAFHDQFVKALNASGCLSDR